MRGRGISRGVEMNGPRVSERRCRSEGCAGEVLPPLASEGVCLEHYVELVVRRADQVRQQCLKAQPVDEETLDWLLSDAPHTIQSLSSGANAENSTESEKILELLLCLANLQDYITHHSLHVKRAR
jgi:hypothetical protein